MKAWIFIGCALFSFSVSADRFEIFTENGKMGIKNELGQVIIPATFEALGWSDGSFSVIGNITGYRANELWGVMNLQREFITPAMYEALVYGGADNIIARKKINPAQTKTGCITLAGEVRIPFQYDGIAIHGLRAVVFNLHAGKYAYGLIDLNNRIIIPVQYRNITPLGTLRYAVENDKRKIALFREDGKPVTEFKIDSLSSFSAGKAIIYENLKRGLMDREGNIILTPVYRDIRIDDDQVWVLASHEWLFINQQNIITDRLQADEVTRMPGNVLRVKRSAKFGLLNEALETICPLQYDQLDPIQHNRYIAIQNGKYGIVQSDGKPVIPFIYDSLFFEGNIFRAFQRVEGWALVDLNHQVKTQKRYDWIGKPKGGLFPVINNHHWGALDKEGEEMIHCVYDSLTDITENAIAVKYKGQYGIITDKQDWLVAPQANKIQLITPEIYCQKEGSNLILKSTRHGIVYFTDNPIDFHSEFFTEYLPDGTEKIIDYQGVLMKRISPPQADNIEKIFKESEGLRGIQRDGKFGFIDERGRLRIANRYDGIGAFSEGLAAFKLLGKWGFINTSDQIAIQPNYDYVSPFQNGLSVVCRNGACGVIDKTGHPVLHLQYDSIVPTPKKTFRLIHQGKVGLADERGNILIEPRFDSLHELPNDRVIVEAGNKFGVLTQSGLSVIPIIYDTLIFDEVRNQFLALTKSNWKKAP
jgi:hypothetical protein